MDFYTQVPAARESFENWYAIATVASWNSFAAVKATFPQTDIKTVQQNAANGGKASQTFLIFDLRGNHYRIVCSVHFNTGILYVRYAGDHKGYDKLDFEKL